MKKYYRVMLGQGSVYAAAGHAGNFIGTDFEIHQDLTPDLPEDWREFNKKFIPIFMANHPGKSKIGAGLACGALWTVSKGLQNGDIVLCPDGAGAYLVGEVASDYYYSPGQTLPHRRGVKWATKTIQRNDMSDALKNSTGSIGTVSTITQYAAEIETLRGDQTAQNATLIDPDVEDPVAFALEKHLEDFLVANWAQTDLGKDYDIFAENGEQVGRAGRHHRAGGRQADSTSFGGDPDDRLLSIPDQLQTAERLK